MKTMTCRELGGACDETFSAETFEEMAELSKKHAMDMMQQNFSDHLEAMNAMKTLMAKPGAMQEWFEGKRKEFETLTDD